MTIKLRDAVVPLYSNSESGTDRENYANNLILKGRSGTVVEVHVRNPELKEGILPEIFTDKGVYLANAIIRANEQGKALATILNTRVTD
ncbi:hypothetical protein RUM44_005757, partial [Polyplax serrata]